MQKGSYRVFRVESNFEGGHRFVGEGFALLVGRKGIIKGWDGRLVGNSSGVAKPAQSEEVSGYMLDAPHRLLIGFESSLCVLFMFMSI